MGVRFEPVPVCDADKRDAKAVRKFAWTEDDGSAYTIELGDDETHSCYPAVMEFLDSVRPHAQLIVVEVVSESLPRLTVEHTIDGETVEPAAEAPTPERKTSDEGEEAPPPLKLLTAHLSDDQPKQIREWWKGSKAAKREFGEPTYRGRLAQAVVDAYCEDMNLRAARAREMEEQPA